MTTITSSSSSSSLRRLAFASDALQSMLISGSACTFLAKPLFVHQPMKWRCSDTSRLCRLARSQILGSDRHYCNGKSQPPVIVHLSNDFLPRLLLVPVFAIFMFLSSFPLIRMVPQFPIRTTGTYYLLKVRA